MTSYGTIVATPTPSLLLAGAPFTNNAALVSYTVANNDETNPVWIGESRSLSPTDPSAVQVAPLGSAPVDPTTTTYIVTNGPNVQVFLFAGGGTWAPSPAQVAAQINALGLATATNQTTQNATAVATNNVLGSGIALPINAAQETGGNLGVANGYLGGTSPGALVSGSGRSIAQDMLHANVGVTSELAALLASGVASGTPGGIPLLNFDNLVHNQATNTVITTISALVLGPYNVNQPSYTGAFGYEVGGAGGYLNVLVQWYDAIGNQVETESYWFFAGTAAFPNVVTLKGPTRGNSFYITFTAYTTNGTLTFFDIYQSSRIVDRHDWRSMIWSGSNLAGTIPTSDPPANFLAYCNAPALAAGTSLTFLLPFFSGKISLYMQTSSGTSDMQVSLLNTADQANTSGDQFWLSNTSAQGIGYTPEIYLPRSQCSLKVNNGNAAVKNLFCALIAADY